MTRFLNVVYSNINGKNIDLVIQLFETMNEFTAVGLFGHLHIVLQNSFIHLIFQDFINPDMQHTYLDMYFHWISWIITCKNIIEILLKQLDNVFLSKFMKLYKPTLNRSSNSTELIVKTFSIKTLFFISRETRTIEWWYLITKSSITSTLFYVQLNFNPVQQKKYLE